MSVTYHLECDTCKKSLWIGQRDFIYRGEEATMELLEQFLYAHASTRDNEHPLFFRSSLTSMFTCAESEWEDVSTGKKWNL